MWDQYEPYQVLPWRYKSTSSLKDPSNGSSLKLPNILYMETIVSFKFRIVYTTFVKYELENYDQTKIE